MVPIINDRGSRADEGDSVLLLLPVGPFCKLLDDAYGLLDVRLVGVAVHHQVHEPMLDPVAFDVREDLFEEERGVFDYAALAHLSRLFDDLFVVVDHAG